MPRAATLLTISLMLLVATALPILATERIVVNDLNGVKVAPIGGSSDAAIMPPKSGANRHAARRATVLIFITTDCPIANACAPEIERIYRAYAPKQIGFYLVYVDASQTAKAVRKHHDEYGYTCPAVLDSEHKLVNRAQALVTPEAAIFAPDGRLLYHGRIDDRAVAFGQVRSHPTSHDLRDVLDAYLQRKPIPVSSTKAVGCFISDLRR